MYEFFIFIVVLFAFLYLKSRINQLDEEIDSLKIKFGIKNNAVSQSIVQEPAPPLETESAAEAIPAAAVLEVVEKPAAAMEQEPPASIETENKSGENLEFKIGSKIFTGVGVVAVICAVGFFLRYAFENNLINEFGRVALGVAAGIILLIVGELTRKRFANYGQALTGGGLGVLYVSFYAAFSFYKLMAQPTAFFAMILVTAAGILLSLRQNSMALAMFAQVGGFLTPLLINSGNASPHILFLYVALLDVAVFLTAFYKLWQPLSAVSFAGTALAYSYWYFNFYSSLQFTPAFGYLSLFFAIFLCVPFIQYFVKKSPENSWDLMLVSANPLFYFSMSYAIIDPLYPDFMGWFTMALGVFYCAMAAAVGGKNERDSLFRHFLLTAGFVLLAIAVPIQFDGKWIVAAWAAEALAFTVTGFKMKMTLYRGLGGFLFFAALIKLLIFESSLPGNAMVIFNGRFLSYALYFGAAAAGAYLYRRYKMESGNPESPMFYLLLLEAALAVVVGSSFEVHDFFGNYGKWTVVVWAIEALAFIAAGFRWKLTIYRVLGNCLLLATLFRLSVFEGSLETGSMPIFNLRLLAYAVFFTVVAASAYLYRRRKLELGEDERQLFSILALEGAFAGLFGLSLEIHNFFGEYWYPILWTFGGLAAGLLSFRLKSVTLRCVTYITFAAALFHLLVFDSHIDVLKYVPLANTRVFAFAASAIAVRLFFQLFRANKDKMSKDEYQLFQPTLFMMFHFLNLLIISAEIISYCDKQALSAGRVSVFNFDNLKNVFLSAAWTVYGVILMAIGIVKKTTYERFLAIALFGIVIIKVFLVDTADLGDIYRFFSFIILGCFLLLVGYLYYRYQDRIRKFVQAQK